MGEDNPQPCAPLQDALCELGPQDLKKLLRATHALNKEYSLTRVREAILSASCELLSAEVAAVLEFGESSEELFLFDNFGRQTKFKVDADVEKSLPGQSYLGKSVQIKREAGLHDGLLHKFETPGHPLPSAASVLCVLDVGTKLTTQDAGAVAAVLQAFVSHDAELPVEALLRSWSDQVSSALSRASCYEKEVAELKKSCSDRLEKLKEASRIQLHKVNEEADLLSEENFRLQQESRDLQGQLRKFGIESNEATRNNDMKVPEELLQPGDPSTVPLEEICCLENHHGGSNVLSVSLLPSNPRMVLSGAVDKKVLLTDWESKKVEAKAELPSPVLSIDVNPTREELIVAACMDGSHHLLQLSRSAELWTLSVVRSVKEHTRQGAIRVRWSPDGRLFATCSVDKTVCIYTLTEDSSEGPVSYGFVLLNKMYFNTGIEGIEMVQRGESTKLILGLRDDNYIHIIDCMTFSDERLNVNEDKTDHVSFTMMDLRASPNGKYLLVATDHNRHFLFEIESGRILRNFYGHSADAYSTPRVAWDHSGKFIYSNSQKDNLVYVWCVVSQIVVHKLPGHRAVVRDLDYQGPSSLSPGGQAEESSAILATVSFDKSLRIWRGASGVQT